MIIKSHFIHMETHLKGFVIILVIKTLRKEILTVIIPPFFCDGAHLVECVEHSKTHVNTPSTSDSGMACPPALTDRDNLNVKERYVGS